VQSVTNGFASGLTNVAHLRYTPHGTIYEWVCSDRPRPRGRLGPDHAGESFPATRDSFPFTGFRGCIGHAVGRRWFSRIVDRRTSAPLKDDVLCCMLGSHHADDVSGADRAERQHTTVIAELTLW